MLSPLALFVDVVWLLSLAGVLATLSYNDWYRSERGWRWRQIWPMPRVQLPLNGSLALLSTGLALNGVTGSGSAPWWQTLLWALLALFYIYRTVPAWRTALRSGYNTPILEDEIHHA